MPVKRNRPGSSSYLDAPKVMKTDAATVPSVGAPKVMKIDAAAEPKLLTVASPVSVGGSDRLRIGGFLERCHYCKKPIANNSEVFMYRDLCAFCSVECRDFQIKLDQSAKTKIERPKDELAQG